MHVIRYYFDILAFFKAWFRELPAGILDSLSPEQVMQCQTEDECAELVRHLPHTEASLLDWAINLMADVVLHEHVNKMNARNIAMVFAPNMTQVCFHIFSFSSDCKEEKMYHTSAIYFHFLLY